MFQVIKQVKTLVGSKIKKTGLLIDKNFPILGASADGLGEDFVLEVKCPTTHSTLLNYVDNGVVKPKVYLYYEYIPVNNYLIIIILLNYVCCRYYLKYKFKCIYMRCGKEY